MPRALANFLGDRRGTVALELGFLALPLVLLMFGGMSRAMLK